MNKKRILAGGAALLVALALGGGLSAAQTAPTTAERPSPTSPMYGGDHDAMHAQMRGHMPEDVQAQCDAMHARMGTGSMGMTGRSGMGHGRMTSSMMPSH